MHRLGVERCKILSVKERLPRFHPPVWRASLSDEAWRDWLGVAEDAEWHGQVARDFGVDLRPGE